MRKLPADLLKSVPFASRAAVGLGPPSGLRRWIAGVLSILLALVFCISSPVALPQPPVSEYAVKAAYLLNFGKFVRVAGKPQHDAFDICILGPDPFGHSLDDITANESIDGHPVHVVRIASADAAHQCSIAYIVATDKRRLDDDIAALAAADVLTVSDAPNFIQHGGMIEFVLVSSHVRFIVNLDAVHQSHIVLSSELLRVAASVTGSKEPDKDGGKRGGKP